MNSTVGLSEAQKQFAANLFESVRELSKSPGGLGGVTRLGYSEVETRCLKEVERVGRELDLEVEYDESGCLWMTLKGRNSSLPAVVSGSHIDSVPDGGNFDGLAGIVAALTVAHGLRENGIVLERDFRVLAIRCEEQALIGSRAMMGMLKPVDLERRWTEDSPRLEELMTAAGIDPKKCMTGSAVVDLSRIEAFLELHIEQAPRLAGAANGLPRTGIVQGIRGSKFHHVVKCRGTTAHSGALDFEFRRDAVAAVVELMHAMRMHWIDHLDKGLDLVYTNGVVRTPDWSAFNKICGEVVFSVDMRTLSMDVRNEFYDLFRSECARIESEFGVEFEFDEVGELVPMKVDAGVFERIQKAADRQQIPTVAMPSGAGHDSQNFGIVGVPFGMIFVANDNGSHNPSEAMSIDDFMQAAAVLFEAVRGWDE